MTDLGNLAVIGPAMIGVCMWLRWRCGAAVARSFALPIAAGLAATVALKIVFRHIGGGLAGTALCLSPGAPSGHMQMAVAVYGGLSVMLWRGCRGPIRPLAAVLTALVLAGIAVTRVTLHEHTPGDVVLGSVIGAAGVAWSARGGAERPSLTKHDAMALLALLVTIVALMHASGLRIDSARII